MPVVPKAPLLPSDVVRGPRPLAPPLKLATAPIPAAPPFEPERIFAPDEAVTVPKGGALDDALLEHAPSSQTPAAPTSRRWIAIGGAVLLIVLIATAAVVGAIVSKSGSPTPPRPTVDVQPSKTVAAIVPSVANPPPLSTTATVVIPTATASVMPEPSSSADVDPSASAAPTTRPHTRPRPTYDPMGI
jgi:hypothetical protein